MSYDQPDNYKNTQTYYHTSHPDAKARYERIMKEINEALLTAAEREKEIEAAKTEHKEWIGKQNEKFYAEEARIHDKFLADVEENWGFDKYPVHVRRAIHSAAWERGHSSGYSEVWNCYYDLVAFVDTILVGATWAK